MAAFSCNVCGRGFDFGGCSCDSLPDKETIMTTTDTEQTAKLARAFSAVLLEWLGPGRVAEAAALNDVELNPDVCHTHDFCDANEAMLVAFERALGREADVQSDDDTALWNAAWDRAKADRFAA